LLLYEDVLIKNNYFVGEFTMNSNWRKEKLNSIEDILSEFIEIRAKKERWVFRLPACNICGEWEMWR
jgi:hypothetical protein